jgi:hypothetical protein
MASMALRAATSGGPSMISHLNSEAKNISASVRGQCINDRTRLIYHNLMATARGLPTIKSPPLANSDQLSAEPQLSSAPQFAAAYRMRQAQTVESVADAVGETPTAQPGPSRSQSRAQMLEELQRRAAARRK